MAKVSDLRNRMRGIQTDYAASTGENIHTEAALGVALEEQRLKEEAKDIDAGEEGMMEQTKAAARQQNIQTALSGLTLSVKAGLSGKKGLVGMKKRKEEAEALQAAESGATEEGLVTPGITGWDKNWGNQEAPTPKAPNPTHPLYKIGTRHER